jgi:uncharacterized membrane protein
MAKSEEQSRRAEHRWPAMGAILVALTLYALLPSTFLPIVRYTVVAIGLVLLVPMFVLNPLRMTKETRWSRALSIIVTALLASANTLALIQLVIHLLNAGSDEGGTLVVAALQVWTTQVIVFALIFWELDRGGPVARTRKARGSLQEADFRFPQDEDGDTVEEVALGSSKKSGWTANYVDYAYFSLTNSMAFSAADAMPLTHRAKILCGIEAFGAYVLLVLVIARAVSLLGS